MCFQFSNEKQMKEKDLTLISQKTAHNSSLQIIMGHISMG